MHLKQLKLAGFKSFADSTTLLLPSQLTAIVGPNGCGKSNIIDALLWVLGESSAKNLRGESMTDVIFNGSSQRKAVGQAMVELTFDNSLGRLGGQFGSYQEIAIKRVLTRDGESSYFLNNSRCRRRDIRDIFLGTGAGSNGYSIISQGTVSRLVEARPEELRAYLEEAAGISKYKERRRETLMRIEHTRENLLRIADIREELDKQLQRLERQAKAAERFKSLKAEERVCKTEILALKWRELTEVRETKKNELRSKELDYERHQSKATEAYKQSTSLREKMHEDNNQLQQIQEDFYRLAMELVRLEEGIQQQENERQRLKKDEQQIRLDEEILTNQIKADQKILEDSRDLALQLQNHWQILEAQLMNQQESMQKKLEKQSDWNEKEKKVQTSFGHALGEMKLSQLRVQHLEERRQQLLLNLEKRNEELISINTDALINDLENQKTQRSVRLERMENEESEYQKQQEKSKTKRQQLNETEKDLHQVQDQIHHLSTQLAKQQTAQKVALGLEGKQAEIEAFAAKPRLVELLQVEKKWQLACEFVLFHSLNAIVLDSVDLLWPDLHSLRETNLQFLSLCESKIESLSSPTLAEKIKGLKPAGIHCLDKIYAASSLNEALSLLPKLQLDESVITEEGVWLAKTWVKIAGSPSSPEKSLLLRQEELNQLKQTLEKSEEKLSLLKSRRNNLHEQVRADEETLDKVQQNLLASQEDLKSCQILLNQKEQILFQAELRQKVLEEEVQELSLSLEELVLQQEEAHQSFSQRCLETKNYEQEQKELMLEKVEWEKEMHASRLALENAGKELHRVQLTAQREELKINQLKESLLRDHSRLQTLNERSELLAKRSIELNAPFALLKESLSTKIKQHQELEAELNLRKEAINELNRQLEAWEVILRKEQQSAQAIQEKIQQERVEEQSLIVRTAGILEALAEFDATIELVLAKIPENQNQLRRERDLEDILDKIKRLGAINLVAIEECEAELKRKQHLDEQYQDLTEALSTLDLAITTMDKETEKRLRLTFNEVNTAFQSIFPRLLGGGHALLELSCDNLLEAGVIVRAQPPGKRNSTIHLLSGGEKAMTAIALIFAIFQLNPSPFCLLDEVDAPLDEVNVGRFCDLVKEMSQFIQFLFITHNKGTMELAEHLIGVTMHEPGVSRVVAVDVKEALAMAQS